MSQLIGAAELEIGVDLAPLDAGLLKAERKTAEAMAILQKMLDRHVEVTGGKLGALATLTEAGLAGPLSKITGLTDQATSRMVAGWAAVRAEQEALQGSLEKTAAVTVASADVQVAAADRVAAAWLEAAAAARAAKDEGDAAIGRSVGADLLGGLGLRGGAGGGRSIYAVEGVRGPSHAGSRQDPVVVVLEAARYTPLGGMAASVGENSLAGAGASSGSQGGSPFAGAVPLDRNGRPIIAGAATGDQERKHAASEAALAAATARLADLMARPETRPAQTSAPSAVVLPGQQSEQQNNRTIVLPPEVHRQAASRGGAIPVIVTETDPAAANTDAAALAGALAAKGGSGSAPHPGQFASAALSDYYAAKGLTAAAGPDGKLRLYGTGGVPGTGTFGAAAGAAAGSGAAGGGSGGGGVPPWLTGLLWGSHGGGGRGRPPGWFGYLAGAGAGLGAGFGSLGSFAGFGPEHILLTAGGIAGSGVAALGGGALLAAGAAGKIGVGGGSDALVMKSTITDTKSLYTAYENLSLAIRTYGKGSEKAIEAQYELNKLFNELGHTAGVKAEEGVAQAARALNKFWDASTSGARVQGSKILMQFIELGKDYVPLVAHAAEQNLSEVNKGLKPLFEWLKGPEGMGIFLQLEDEFRQEIPTAMQALDQGFQFFAKTIAYVAPETGKFMTDLDHFFTKWNSPDEFSVWEGEINKLINDFHVWGAFVKILGADLVDLFNKDAHTGQSLIEDLTKMLDKVHEYEESTKGSKALSNIFLVHREEVIALLGALTPLVSGFSNIYTTVAPPLVKAVTQVAKAFDWLLETIDKAGSLGKWVIGLTLIAAKLKVLNPLLAATRAEFFGVAEAETAGAAGAVGGSSVAAEGSVVARAMATQASSDELAAAGLLGGGESVLSRAKGLATSGTLLRGGLAGAGGLLGGSLLAGAVGAKGTLGNAISAAGGGAGAGFVLGPAAGAALGTEIAPVVGTAIGAGLGFAAPYAVKFLDDVFSSHAPDYGKKLAEGIVGPYTAVLGVHTSKAIESAGNAYQAAVGEGPHYKRTRGRGGAGAPHPADTAAIAAAAAREGKETGLEVSRAFEHVRFPTAGVFIENITRALYKLPEAARRVAAMTMLELATKMEQEKNLPKGAVTNMIRELNGVFPGLITNAQQTAHKLAQTFELPEAKAKLGSVLQNVSQLFVTNDENTLTNAAETMGRLADIIAHGGPHAKAAATQSYGEVREAVAHQLSLTLLTAEDKSEVIAARVALGMETMSQAVSRGISQVNRQMESELTALGAPKEISVPFVTGKGSSNFKKNPTPFSKGAQGMLMQVGSPWDVGPDSVRMNAGGVPIEVAPGEQVAVFNRHQLPEVNARFADVGGLGGFFDQGWPAHNMATGGTITPHVGGSGALAAIVRAGLGDVAKAANAKAAAHVSSLAGASYAGVAGRGGSPSANEELGRRMMLAAGYPASEWPYLQKLWTQESGWNANSVNSSSGAYGIPQALSHGNVYALGDARAQIAWGLNYIRGRYGSPSAAWAHEVAYNWYGRGGALRFAKGGRVPQRARKLPKVQDWKVHPFGRLNPLSETWWGQGFYNQLGGIMGESGGVARGSEEYELATKAAEFALQRAPHEGQYIVTPNSALGETGGPHEEPGNIKLRLGQLGQLEGIEGGVLGNLNKAWELSNTVLKSFTDAIHERHKAIAELQARIRKNLEAIKKCREVIKRQEAALKKAKKGSPEAKKIEGEIKAENAKIAALHAENQRLGGASDEVGSSGRIGTLAGQVSDLEKGRETVKGYRTTIGGVTGVGGERQQVADTLEELGKQVEELGAGALHAKLLEAGGSGESSTELLEREKAQLEERLKIKTEEDRTNEIALKVFGGPGDIGAGGVNAFAAAAFGARGLVLPYGGSFAKGGVVPGPPGSPKAIIAHGDEEVVSRRDREPSVTFYQHNEIMHPSDPAVHLELARSAVKGFGFQGQRRAKRARLGV